MWKLLQRGNSLATAAESNQDPRTSFRRQCQPGCCPGAICLITHHAENGLQWNEVYCLTAHSDRFTPSEEPPENLGLESDSTQWPAYYTVAKGTFPALIGK